MRRIHSFFNGSTPRHLFSNLALSLLAALLLTAAGCNSKPSAARTDDAITSDVQNKIAAETALGGQSIQVSVASGVATLTGAVDSDAARALAANDAAQVQGVRTVVNNLTVVTAQSNPAPVPHPSRPAPAPRNTASVTPPDHKRKDKDKKEKHPATLPPPPPAQVAAVEPPPAPAPLPPPPPEPVQQVAPPAPPQPIVKTITIPDGTTVAIRITESLDSETAVPGSPFHGVLATDLISDGVVAIAHGSNVVGRIADAKDAAHYKGSALLSLELTELTAGKSRIPVVTEPLVQEGPGRGGNTAKKVGGGAVLGAIIGGIAGGGKGAAIGSVAGAGVGAGANTVTRGQQVKIESESLLRFRLQSPINVTVTIKPASARSSESNGNPDPALESRPN